MEGPNYFFTNLFLFIVPFASYYLGIIIRKVALPGKNSLPISHQLLLGIPASLVVVSPMLPIIDSAQSNIPALLITFGVIMEHGMLLNETLTAHLKKLLSAAGENPVEDDGPLDDSRDRVSA